MNTTQVGRIASLLLVTGCVMGEPDEPIAGDDVAEAQADLRSATIETPDGPVDVVYEVQGGLAVVGGDMVIGTVEEMERKEAPVFRSYGVRWWGTWSDGIVPYVIEDSVQGAVRTAVEEAIVYWNSESLAWLRPRNGEADYIRFIVDPSLTNRCDAWLGKRGGGQEVRVGPHCATRAPIIHEIGHAFGLEHEHARPDRDSYINIDWANVRPWMEFAFYNMFFWMNPQPLFDYDHDSIMHYGSFAFARDESRPTMTKKDGSHIPYNTVFSKGDLAGIARLMVGGGGDKLESAYSGKCMDVSGASRGRNASVVQWDCHGNDNQRWVEYRPRWGGGGSVVVSKHSGLCLTAPGTKGGQLFQDVCTGASVQRWSVSGGELRNRSTGYCADVAGWSRANGAAIVQWDCHGGGNQRFWWRW